jgi:hypothetical protein
LTKTEKYPAKVMFDCTPYTIAANMLADQCPATCSGGAQSLSADSVTVAAGCYTATTLTTVDSDLAAGNILSGVTIFGIAGTAEEGPDLIWSGVLSSSYDWAGAIGACSSLGAGYSWRLPTIDELESFMSSCNSDPDCLWIYSYNLWSSTEDESYYDEFNLVYPYAYALTGEFGRQSWEKYNTSNVVCVRDA